MIRVRRSVTINRDRDEVYRYWRDLDHLPAFMIHLDSVQQRDARHSQWVAHAPAGGQVEWDAEIVEDRPGELIRWQSLDGSEVPNGGVVRFIEAPGDRGTEVHVDLQYDAPGGRLGAVIAKIFGEEPGQQLRDDLRRFKQVMEVGEVVISEGSPKGAGEGARGERPSRAAGAEVRA
ncbi:MAG: SRPBCC family protein [Gemmatimonadales bacterium]